jgi:DNA-directed RNA polymerase subunit RPC12/RpoP
MRAAMAAGSIFSLRTIQCPACGARLPVDGRALVVACEYCDARVEVQRRSSAPAPSPRPSPGPQRHVAQPHYSGFAWAVLIVPIAVVGYGAFALFLAREDHQASPAPSATATARPVPTPTPQIEPAIEPPPIPPPSDPPPSETPAVVETKVDLPPASTTAPRKSAGKSPASDLPVITVGQARAQLEPKVRACMQKAKAHHLVAYMGNKTSGAVKLLPDSRTRVDGAKVSLAKTSLGRCIDEAGKTVHTAAFKSNYVALDVRNDGVPDPLAHLPKTADMAGVKAKIASFDDAVKACARKHGVEGSRAVFTFKMDGPSGKVTSVGSTYLSKSFRACATAIYEKATFPKVRQSSYGLTYSLDV